MYQKPGYAQRLAIMVSQVLNTLAGGWEDETFSARSYRNREKHRVWQRIHDGIDWVALQLGESDHCYKSWRAGRMRAASYLRESQIGVQSENHIA